MNKYKYKELHGKIVAKYGTLKNFANAIKISQNSVTNKLCGKTPWKEKEIVACSILFNFTKEETAIFFLL